MTANLKVGDVVQLKSDELKMAVAHVPEDGKYIKCVWHTDSGTIAEYIFPAEALTPPSQ